MRNMNGEKKLYVLLVAMITTAIIVSAATFVVAG